MTTTPAPQPIRTRRGPLRILAGALRAAAGIAGTAAILAGLPYLLVTRIGWPLPHRWMGLRALGQDLTTRSLSDTVVINTLAVVVWICWAILLLGALTEIGALALRRPAPSIPGLRPGQVLAAALIALIGISIARTPTAHTPAPDSHRPLPQRTAPLNPRPAALSAAPATMPTTPATPAPVTARPTSDEQHARIDTAGASDRAATETKTVTVQPGQSLFSLAEQYTGSGQNWKGLYQLNADRSEPGGQHLTDPDLIRPGWSIEIPVGAFTGTAPTVTTTHDTAGTPDPQQPTNAPSTTATPNPGPTRTAAPAPTTFAPKPATTPSPSTTPSARGLEPAPATTAAMTPAHQDTDHAVAASHHTEADAHARPALSLAEEAGLIAGGVAVLVSGALVLARRRRERATGPAAPLVALPDPPVARAARRHELAYRHSPNPEETPVGLGAIPVAETEVGEITLQHFASGIALTGAGALPAARALIASALAQGGTHRDQHRALVLATDDDLALLTEAPADAALGLDHPDLERHRSLPELLERAEQLALARARALSDLDETDFDRLEAEHPDEPTTPPCLVIALAEPEHAGRLQQLAASGSRLRIAPIVLGRGGAIPTLALDTAGRPDPGGSLPREAVCYHLSAEAFTDIIATLAAAHSEPGSTAPARLGEFERTPDELFAEHDLPENTTPLPHADADAAADSASSQNPALLCVQNLAATGTSDAATPGGPAHDDRPDPPRPGCAAAARTVWNEGVVRVRATGPLEIHARQADGGWVMLERGLRIGALPLVLALALNPAGISPATVESFFPDSPPDQARRHREEGFKTLRRALQEITGLPHGRLLLREGRTYRFNPDLVSVDLWCRDEAGKAAAAETDLAASLALTDQALGFHHGPLAADRLLRVEFEWAEQARTQARTAAMSLATAAATRAKEAGEIDTAIAYLERAIAIAPDIETNHRHVMILHHRAGHYAEAQAAYQRTREYFEREFDGLSESTRAMARKLFEA